MKCSVSSFSLIIFSHGDGFGVPVGWCAPSRETHKRTWKKAWCIYSKLKPVSTWESSDRLSVHVQTEHSREMCFKTDRKKSSLILMHPPFVFVRGNNGWQKGQKIINLLKGKMFHVDFHKDLFFIHAYTHSAGGEKFFTHSPTVRRMKALYPLHNLNLLSRSITRTPACLWCTLRDRTGETHKKKGRNSTARTRFTSFRQA